MELKTFLEMVIATAEIELEDLNTAEQSRLQQKIILYANAGMDAIARETFPLVKSITVQGPKEYAVPQDWVKLCHYCGGKIEHYVGEDGKERLLLQDPAEYRITYARLPTFIESPKEEYTFEFPLQVITALVYYCTYHVLSSANDKREYSYFLTQYNQQCVNIAESLPKRAHIVGGVKRGI